jgi:hypothetical protein
MENVVAGDGLYAALADASPGIARYQAAKYTVGNECMATQPTKQFLSCTFFRLDARLDNEKAMRTRISSTSSTL